MQTQVISEEADVEAKIVYFCKDCEKLVSGIRIGKKFAYKCGECGTKNVAFGTEKSVRNFYNVA